jgi:hypothetical protein
VILLNRPFDYLGLLLAGLGDGVERVFHLVFCEEAEEAPKSGSTAIFVLALGVVVALVRPGWAYGKLAEGCFGGAIALKDAALPTL